MSMGSYGVALSGLGDIFDPARNAPAPTGKVVSLAAIQTYQQARDYALAAYHVVEDLAKKHGPSTLLSSAASQYFDVAYYAKMSPADIANDFNFPAGDPLVSFKAMLRAADALVDQWRAVNAKSAPSKPSNVVPFPSGSSTSSVAVPTTVTTAGIGTAKGAVVAIVAGGLLLWALRKKRKGS